MAERTTRPQSRPDDVPANATIGTIIEMVNRIFTVIWNRMNTMDNRLKNLEK